MKILKFILFFSLILIFQCHEYSSHRSYNKNDRNFRNKNFSQNKKFLLNEQTTQFGAKICDSKGDCTLKSTQFYMNVLDYGAVGDGQTDNTQAFQSALDAAAALNGSIVQVPSGFYAFQGDLNIPNAVTLQGIFSSVPSHCIGENPSDKLSGTVLLAYNNKGNANASAFITLNEDSTLEGVVIYYPEQPQNPPSGIPTPYPYSISMINNNAAVINVELLNPYQAISAVGSGRHYISKVQGQPILTGLFIDQTYDIGRVENVHWNPWWSDNINVTNFQLTQGRAFVIARSDWEYFFNTFAFGYAIGYHFITSSSGTVNGNFLGIGADLMTIASVMVEGAQPAGILITNGEFTAFTSTDWCTVCEDYKSTHVIVKSTTTGPVKFVNSAFWGPAYQVAIQEGSSTLSFQSCNFAQWDTKNQGLAAVQAQNGNIILMGNDFLQNSPQVSLSSGTKKAVVIGNVITGTQNITYDPSVKTIINGNIDDSDNNQFDQLLQNILH